MVELKQYANWNFENLDKELLGREYYLDSSTGISRIDNYTIAEYSSTKDALLVFINRGTNTVKKVLMLIK